MQSKVTCDIELDSPTDAYYAGQVVHGDIDLQVNETIKLKEIFLFVRGRTKCRYGYGRNRVVGNQSIFNTKINFVVNEIELTSGTYKYKFDFALPLVIPSSVEKELGSKKFSVKYNIVLYLVRPWNFDIEFNKDFKVYYGLNLNMNLKLKVPTSKENEDLIASIPRTGFVPGEEISVNVQLKNPNDDRIQKIVCVFYMEVSHEVSTGCCFVYSKSYNDKIVEKEKVTLRGQSNYDVVVKIPSENIVATTIDPNMKLIRITYKLAVKVYIKKIIYTSTSRVEFPIKIGVVPFLENGSS